MATDSAAEIGELKAKLASIEAVLDPDSMRKEADGLRVAGRRPGPVGGPGTGTGGHPQALLP
jgi:hypothetical protein